VLWSLIDTAQAKLVCLVADEKTTTTTSKDGGEGKRLFLKKR
jgi:hypothetical protein